MTSTPKQIAYIKRLADAKGLSSIGAAEAYGLGMRAARELSVQEASDLISWLLGKPERGTDRITITPEAQAAGDARAAEFVAKYPNLRN